MAPYRDYRGVPSIGAWKWLPEQGYGVATEVDVADAFRPLYVLRTAIRTLLGLNKPIYEPTAAYGHFGRTAEGDYFPWERLDLVEDLKAAVGVEAQRVEA